MNHSDSLQSTPIRVLSGFNSGTKSLAMTTASTRGPGITLRVKVGAGTTIAAGYYQAKKSRTANRHNQPEKVNMRKPHNLSGPDRPTQPEHKGKSESKQDSAQGDTMNASFDDEMDGLPTTSWTPQNGRVWLCRRRIRGLKLGRSRPATRRHRPGSGCGTACEHDGL